MPLTEIKNAKSIVWIGMRGSSKTTNLGLFNIVATTKSNNGEFLMALEEFGLGILTIDDQLRTGHFPPGTDLGAWQANIILKVQRDIRSGRLSEKIIVIPQIEFPGELIESKIGKFGRETYKEDAEKEAPMADEIDKKINEAHGYIIMAPIDTVEYFKDGALDVTENSQISRRIDTNLSRLLSKIYEGKSKANNKTITGICILITKADRMFRQIKTDGIDLRDRTMILQMMKDHFPNTLRELRLFDPSMKKVQVIPTWVNLKRDEHNVPLRWPAGVDGKEGGEIILVENNMPSFSYKTVERLVDYIIKDFGA